MRMFIVFVVFMEWFQWVHGALLSEVTSTIKSQLTLNNMFAFAEEESESIIFGYGISGFVDSQSIPFLCICCQVFSACKFKYVHLFSSFRVCLLFKYCMLCYFYDS